MLARKDIEALSDLVEDAEQQTRKQWERGEIETEPAFTDRFLGAVAALCDIRGQTSSGVAIEARTLRDRGPGASEREFGADYCSVFRVVRDGLATAKGMLVQAKRSGAGGLKLTRAGREPGGVVRLGTISADLRRECQRMLAVTPDAFVVVYPMVPGLQSRFVSAHAVLHANPPRGKPQPIGSKTVREFYWDHFACFLGDRNITSHSDEDLRRAAERYGVQRVLEVSAFVEGPR